MTCFYVRDYQIPNAPKIELINSQKKNSNPSKIIHIKYYPDDPSAPQISETGAKKDSKKAKFDIRKKLEKRPSKGILKKPKSRSSKKYSSYSSDSQEKPSEEKTTKSNSDKENTVKKSGSEFMLTNHMLSIVGIHIDNPKLFSEDVREKLGDNFEEECPKQELIKSNLSLIKKFIESIYKAKCADLVNVVDKRGKEKPVFAKSGESKFAFNLNLDGINKIGGPMDTMGPKIILGPGGSHQNPNIQVRANPNGLVFMNDKMPGQQQPYFQKKIGGVTPQGKIGHVQQP